MRGPDILDGLRNKGSTIDSSYLPKVVTFSGEDKDAYKFIETYKMGTSILSDFERIELFGMYCGIEVLEWYRSQSFESWEELERKFKDSWCKVIHPTQALNEVMNLRQGEEEHLRTYITCFEFLKRFFLPLV